MSSQPPPYAVLRLPYYSDPWRQPNAWTEAGVLAVLAGATAGALACLPLANYQPHHLWPAIKYEAGQLYDAWRYRVSPMTWPWQLALPFWTALVAGAAGARAGYLAGYMRGFVQRTGNLIVKPGKVYLGDRNGVTIGGATLSRQDETNGILVVAGQGGGKTVPISRMMRQAWQRGERALILDGKPEFAGSSPNLHGDGKGVLNSVGSKTWLLALSDTRAARWAVGEDVYDRATASRWATSLVSSLDTKNLNGGDFWIEGAQVFIETAILMCIESFGQKWGLGDFYATLRGLIALDPASLKAVVTGYLPGSAGIVTVEAEQTLAGFMSNLATAIKPIDTMVRFETLKSPKNTISIRRWLQSRDHLIIGSASTDMRASAAFANALIELAAEQLLLRPDADPNDSEAAAWLFLDEFGAAGKCNLLRKQMIKLRSKRVRVVIGIQSLQQLKEEYGPEAAQIILGSMDTLLLGRNRGGGDEGDGEWACAQLGMVGGLGWTQPSADGQWGSYQHVERDLVPATEFGRLGAVYDTAWRNGKFRQVVTGVRLILKSGVRAAELFIPVEDVPTLRPPIVTAELAVKTDLHGRVAGSLQVIQEELAQQAAAKAKKKGN